MLSSLCLPIVLAATYLVPPDIEMIQRADDIAVVVGVASVPERTARGGIVTRHTLRVVEVLKGKRAAGEHLILTELGGRLGADVVHVTGAPRYEPGERYLVFTETNGDGEPITFGMELGQFRFERSQLVRNELHGWNQNLESFVDRPRDANGFMEYIRGIVGHRLMEADYFVDALREEKAVSASAVSRSSYLIEGQYRWQSPQANIVTAGTLPGLDGIGAVTGGIAQWNGTGVGIAYAYGGQNEAANKGFTAEDGINAVLLNDPNGEIPSGVAGSGGITRISGEYTLDGEEFFGMAEVDVVINNDTFGANFQSCLNSVITHELGHTLGFRHSDRDEHEGACAPPLECSASAIMTSIVGCKHNGVLQAWDTSAATVVYGATQQCPDVRIFGVSATPSAGNFIVTVDHPPVGSPPGIPPMYEWFEGDTPGIGGVKVSSGKTMVVPAPAVVTTYWVRVTNNCGKSAVSELVVVSPLPRRRRSVGRS